MSKRHDGDVIQRRMLTGLTFAAIASVVLCAVVPSPAAAHAAYKDSDPADESTVPEAPSEIWAEYTEPVTDGASYMKVFDPCGEQVDNGDSYTQGYRIYVTMSGSRAGTYSVDWFAASSIDPHTTRGTFKFTVTEGEPCPGPAEQEGEERSNGERSSGGTGSVRRSGGGDGGSVTGEVGAAERSKRTSERRFGDFPRDKDRSGGDRSVDVAAPNESTETVPEEPGIFEDIPIGGLVLALALAALIGAAGGFIYAGIMGYTRPAD